MEIDELDVARRRLTLLLAMCERKCKNQFLGPTDKLAAGTFNVDRSMIVRVNDLGGFRDPAASGTASGIARGNLQYSVDLVDDSSTGVQDSDADDACGVQESDEESRQVKEARRLSRFAEITSPGKSLKDIDEISQKLMGEEREDEERRKREEEVRPVADWGDDDKADKDDQISKELGAHHIWNTVARASINVNTEWSI
jgi:hypothetical protein